MKSYIDVSFTMEEDLSHWSDKDKDKAIENIELLKELFITEFYDRFSDYENSIKDLKASITFEDRK